MKKPYHICLQREISSKGFNGYSCMVLELQGCFSQGETLAEAERNILDAMRMWLEVTIETGQCVPPPADYKEIMSWHKQRGYEPVPVTIMRKVKP